MTLRDGRVAPSEDLGRGSRLAIGVALFVLAFCVRALPWRDVWLVDRVLPTGNDAFYHLRRIAYALFGAEAPLSPDRFLHFPEGAHPIWSPAFDATLAALLRPFVPPLEHGGLLAMERLAVWIPPLIGAGTVVALYGIALRHFGLRVAVGASALVALLSGHFWYSQVGYLDHHVAVAALACVSLGAGLRWLEHAAAGERAPRRWAALALGVVGAAGLALWPGMLLHVGLVELGLWAWLIQRPPASDTTALYVERAAGYALAALLLVPAAWTSDWPQWGAYSPVVLSRFQTGLYGAATLITLACAALFVRPAFHTAGARGLGFGAISMGTVAIVVWVVPGAGAGLENAWTWLAKREAFQAMVSESQPLLAGPGAWIVATVRLSGWLFLLPLAALFCWQRAWERGDERAALAVFWAVALLLVTLAQKRFFNSASIGLALVSALWLRDVWPPANARARRVAAVLGVAALVAPTLQPYLRPLRNELRALQDEPLIVGANFGANVAANETAGWLRVGTPDPGGWLDASITPLYGVIAPWQLGHWIQYTGRRPTVVDNFGDDLGPDAFAFVDAYFLEPEASGAAAALARGVRYVVSQGTGEYLSRRPGPESLHAALAGPGRAQLAHHRLLFESHGLRLHDALEAPFYRVFELVRGASIEGMAPPGAEIEATLGHVTNRRQHWSYRRRTRAAADGRYRLRVSYASEAIAGALPRDPAYQLRCGDETREVVVAEAAVREGRRVAAPALCREG
jgi:dolichyl-diphosphooligosaccharide--protein glycosyltransferase